MDSVPHGWAKMLSMTPTQEQVPPCHHQDSSGQDTRVVNQTFHHSPSPGCDSKCNALVFHRTHSWDLGTDPDSQPRAPFLHVQHVKRP